MPRHTDVDGLIKLRTIDVERAGRIMAGAFRHDPLWLHVFEGATRFARRFRAFFEVPLRYCLRYGDVYATSRELEGIAAWLPGSAADMAPLGILLSGAFWSGMYVGPDVMTKMASFADILPAHRNKHMSGREYRYVQIVGVATAEQRKGIGFAVMRALTSRCDRDGVWLYLETEVGGNVRFYEKLGFELLEEITLPTGNLPMWLMAREPAAPTPRPGR